jgi:rhomboid family GlyGly-CTERM serine protease
MQPTAVTTKALSVVRRIPFTVAVGLVATLVACVPTAAELLQLGRADVAAGEFWRLATCHVTHWSFEHLQWDLLMFAVLGAVCELQNPWRMRVCTLATATIVSAVVYWFFPDIDFYRGLSGIDTALFVLFAVDLMRDAQRQKNHATVFVTATLLMGFAAKTLFELLAGSAVFVDQQSAGFALIVWDHIVAAVVGMLLAATNMPWQGMRGRIAPGGSFQARSAGASISRQIAASFMGIRTQNCG